MHLQHKETDEEKGMYHHSSRRNNKKGIKENTKELYLNKSFITNFINCQEFGNIIQ